MNKFFAKSSVDFGEDDSDAEEENVPDMLNDLSDDDEAGHEEPYE